MIRHGVLATTRSVYNEAHQSGGCRSNEETFSEICQWHARGTARSLYRRKRNDAKASRTWASFYWIWCANSAR